ncbi:hypothetical protein ZIOFF_070410 [Zingiber officinale]|uniref:non-specific serine/threonine protein kinase n=1 Tax=Zingiber officinale TaxID=94328 RepID=A0A8J5CWQ0_ZINOF|nr:hypothetical protein ZIOFF_070410 [Zingiber officinale]
MSSSDREEEDDERSHDRPPHPWRMYLVKDLIRATRNFHEENKLGEGGFGTIAVKRLKALSEKAEMEFAMEVEILGRADQVVAGAAEGIAYLHHEASPHIVHRDIKASNVLLDSEWNAKVADFGFAKLMPEGVSQLTTRVKGTLGYLAPEYAMWGKVSDHCDVYSFGVLLLEIVSARRPIEKLPTGVRRDIVQWAAPYAARGAWERIADPRLSGRFDREELRNVVTLALRCVEGRPEKRPTMKEVVDILNRRAETVSPAPATPARR